MTPKDGRNIMSLISNIKKHAKLLFIALIILIALIGYLNYGLHKWFGIGCTPDPFPGEPVVVVDDWTDTLATVGYEPAEIVEVTELPDELPESIEGVIYAEGEHEGVEVTVSIVETPDDTIWIKATIDGNEVKWRKVQYMPMCKDRNGTRWTALIECAYVSGSTDWGVGGAYTVIRRVPLIRSSLDLFAVADINPDLRDAPDWYAVGAGLSWHRGAFSIGLHGGYRFMEDAGLHTGVCAGISIGL